LGAGDSLYIANWQFAPWAVPLSAPPGPKVKTWAELLAGKAAQGVTIRVILAQHPPFSPFMSDLAALDALIGTIPPASQDNFKYLASPHPHPLGTHHQKFMVARTGQRTVAFCGGLDISFNRIPAGWGTRFEWHDVAAKV